MHSLHVSIEVRYYLVYQRCSLGSESYDSLDSYVMSASRLSFTSCTILEHELISNSDSSHMIGTINLQSVFDSVTLPLVYDNII